MWPGELVRTGDCGTGRDVEVRRVGEEGMALRDGEAGTPVPDADLAGDQGTEDAVLRAGEAGTRPSPPRTGD